MQGHRRTAFAFITMAVFSLACGSEQKKPVMLSWAVDAAGPFGTGYRTLPITYMAAGTGEDRTLDIHVWYPTEATTGEHPTYEVFFDDPISIVDAPLAPPSHPDGYPVHVYSHGNMGFGGASPFLMRYFASHGWVVVAPDHTGNTLSDNVDPRPPSIYLQRATDVSAVLDWLEGLPSDDPLYKKAMTERVVLSGHSFGAHTCWASAGASFDMDLVTTQCEASSGPFPGGPCSETELAAYAQGVGDARVVGVIPMAGSIDRALFGDQGHTSVTIPVFAMSGTDDPVGAEQQFTSTEGVDMTWIDIEGGCHQAFALGFCDHIADEKVFPIIQTYALAFGRRHVLSDLSNGVVGRLDGSISVADEVEFHRN
jgi:predicted dienelactone hydrolase